MSVESTKTVESEPDVQPVDQLADAYYTQQAKNEENKKYSFISLSHSVSIGLDDDEFAGINIQFKSAPLNSIAIRPQTLIHLMKTYSGQLPTDWISFFSGTLTVHIDRENREYTLEVEGSDLEIPIRITGAPYRSKNRLVSQRFARNLTWLSHFSNALRENTDSPSENPYLPATITINSFDEKTRKVNVTIKPSANISPENVEALTLTRELRMKHVVMERLIEKSGLVNDVEVEEFFLTATTHAFDYECHVDTPKSSRRWLSSKIDAPFAIAFDENKEKHQYKQKSFVQKLRARGAILGTFATGMVALPALILVAALIGVFPSVGVIMIVLSMVVSLLAGVYALRFTRPV